MKKKKQTTKHMTVFWLQKWSGARITTSKVVVILRNERDITTKQQQGWSIKRANWIQFHRKNIIITKKSIEESYSWIKRNILQAAKKTVPKTNFKIKKRSPVAWWNEECEREEKKMRAEYRKHKNKTTKIYPTY